MWKVFIESKKKNPIPPLISPITPTPCSGSTVTRVEGLCMDEGSQYDVQLSLGDSGTGSLKIKDLVITEPLDPDQAYPGITIAVVNMLMCR